VPQKRLYEFLELVNELVGKENISTLNWCDGRTLDFFCSRASFTHRAEGIGKTPVDSAFDKSLSISLVVEPDEVLNQSDLCSNIDGRCQIHLISLEIGLSPEYMSWLDTEEQYVRIQFIAGRSETSMLMIESPSIRRNFIDLARKGGAISCCIYVEEDYAWLIFLDGKEVDEKITVVDKQNYELPHFRELRHQIKPTQELNENERKILICQDSEPLSPSNLMLRIDWAKNSADSGVRGAAVKSLQFWVWKINDITNDYSCKPTETWLSRFSQARKKKETEKVKAQKVQTMAKLLTGIEEAGLEDALCEIALKDVNWKVRYVATQSLREFNSETSEDVLSLLTHDEIYEIRTIATETLTRRQNSKQQISTTIA
jgi:hypothetical protein